MGIMDRVERALDDKVNGTFARVFHSTLKPVDVTAAVCKAMDDGVQDYASNRSVCPNNFSVRLSTADFDRFEQSGLQVMADELANAAYEHAASESYILPGIVSVSMVEDPDLDEGALAVDAQAAFSAAAPSFDEVASPDHPLLEIGDEVWRLLAPVTVVGRGQDADIRVDDSSVSRRHMEIQITPDGVYATDLGSTNGLLVEGHKVARAKLLDGNQLTIGRTVMTFWSSQGENV
ncbi:hypothetical protein BK816_00120 [Boudabousia tangfeifanii]|uniref:FHA domain-containing protein n=1 Tax=Boudabousia tangfeifanii TaxID=1912795 RepID=A0A1D9MI62_9ACTO|nr:DUF3662 and FHA domain-containing protein [Boudabousia tangfeifanii]AOZ71888.1 hypothetical protein BK816_00120 [Boudabousia tangfeifanii]